jgi:hypothetical protein
MKTRIILKALAVCAAVWLVVVLGQKVFGSLKPTAEGVARTVEKAGLADWSERSGKAGGQEAEKRERVIREVARQVNAFDFKEREKARDRRLLEDFFRRLSPDEQALFVDLTLTESMTRWMEALDGMPKEDRRRFVERGLAEIEDGVTGEDLQRMREMGHNLLQRVAEEGFRAYLGQASAETKMDLAPLMEAMSGVMQGMTGPESFQGGMSQ